MHVEASPSFAPRQPNLERPANCPDVHCVALANARKALQTLKRTETKLTNTLSHDLALLARKDELLRQRELLSRESDHRFLNGLQMVSSLLSLQSRVAKDAEAAVQLRNAAERVARIGSVHHRLHALDQVGSVELKQFLEGLCQDMNGMLPKTRAVIEGLALKVPTATGIPLGLIVSELITNAAKHANGEIILRLAMNADRGFALSVSDDGPGLPEGFDPAKSAGLGMKIILSLVKQIGGRLLFGRDNSGRGSRFTVEFF